MNLENKIKMKIQEFILGIVSILVSIEILAMPILVILNFGYTDKINLEHWLKVDLLCIIITYLMGASISEQIKNKTRKP